MARQRRQRILPEPEGYLEQREAAMAPEEPQTRRGSVPHVARRPTIDDALGALCNYGLEPDKAFERLCVQAVAQTGEGRPVHSTTDDGAWVVMASPELAAGSLLFNFCLHPADGTVTGQGGYATNHRYWTFGPVTRTAELVSSLKAIAKKAKEQGPMDEVEVPEAFVRDLARWARNRDQLTAATKVQLAEAMMGLVLQSEDPGVLRAYEDGFESTGDEDVPVTIRLPHEAVLELAWIAGRQEAGCVTEQLVTGAADLLLDRVGKDPRWAQ